MSKNLQDFLADKADDQVREALQGAQSEEQLVEAARRLGYQFTVDELREHFSQLSDEQMSNVSGGVLSDRQFYWREHIGGRHYHHD